MVEIIKFLGGSALLLSFVGWLIRSLMKHQLSKDLETFKHELKAEAERDLAKLSASLQQENERLRIKLSTLENRRVQVLEEVYSKLVDFRVEAESFSWSPLLDNETEISGSADKFFDASRSFYTFFNRHAIFLPASLEKEIKEMHSGYSSVVMDIEIAPPEGMASLLDDLKEKMPKIREEADVIQRKIALGLRELLGVES